MKLEDRMKEFYEKRDRTYLIRRMPVIIRIDGKAFHTFTKGFDKPFDPIMVACMEYTTKTLCEQIQGCICGYTQSDEISLFLCDYQAEEATAWFDNQVQKICSVSASIATLAFNKKFIELTSKLHDSSRYTKALSKGAMFDSRCFNIPLSDLLNYFIWRQRDAIMNSKNATARHYFSHCEMCGLSSDELVEKLLAEKGIDWNGLHNHQQRGMLITRKEVIINQGKENEAIRHKWLPDEVTPLFTDDAPDYLKQQ